MTLYYNPTTKGFYDTEIHDSIPSGSIEISAAEHQALLDAQARGYSIVAGPDGRPAAREPLPVGLQTLKTHAKAYIESKRAEEESKGMPYTFPDGTQDTVQLRNDRDLVNINGVVIQASIYLSKGITTQIPFRAGSNAIHMLSPLQALEMGVASSAYISSLYQKAWDLKKKIDDATTPEEVNRLRIW